MIWEWLAQTPVFLVAAALFFLPGVGIGAALRIRGLALWALAPVGSVVLFAVLAIVYEKIGVQWNGLSVVVGVALVVALIWLATIKLGPARKPPPVSASTWILISAIALGSILGALRFAFYVESPDAISQTNDAIFHLNALRWVEESGSASSITLSGVIGSNSFYPGAWHALSSATAMLSLGDIPTAVNMVSLVIITLVWPLGIVWFTRVVLWPYRKRHMIAFAPAFAGVLSASMLSFPMMLFQWGVLYPNALSMAILPAAAAVVLIAPSWLAGRGPVEGKTGAVVIWLIVVAASLGAMALSQPSTLLAWGVVVVCWFVSWSLLQLGAATVAKRLALIAGAIAAVLMLVLVWRFLSGSTSGSHWPPYLGRVDAAVEIIFNSQLMMPPAILVSILMLLGLIYTLVHRRVLWLSVVWVIFSAFYFVAATVGRVEVRELLLGAWYADPYRLAALAPLAVIPLAAVGIAWAASWLSKMVGGTKKIAAATVALLAVAGAVDLAVAPVIQMRLVTEGISDAESRYAENEDSFLSTDERILLERLANDVPDEALIIANPSTGAAFGYALSGIDIYPRTWSPPRSDQWNILAKQLNTAGTNSLVCPALEAYGSPEYVLDFGPGETTSGRWLMPGMTDFANRPGFELVDQQGDASLWRITACN